MKILYLTSALGEQDGWARYGTEVVRGVRRAGVTPLVYTALPSALEPDERRALGHRGGLLSFQDGRSKPLRIALDALRLARIARACDLIHVLAEPLAPLGRRLSAGRRPCIVNLVGTYSIRTLNGHWAHLYARSFADASRLCAISHYTARRFSEAMAVPAGRVSVVPLAVRAPCPGELPAASVREPAFVTVGEIKPRKGHLYAVRALAKVRETVPAAKLYVAGYHQPDAYFRELMRTIEELGLRGAVEILGHVDAAGVEALYRRVRGLVVPSVNAGDAFEGFGLVHLEANARGVPAIGSYDCGNEDAIADGVSGYLVPQQDVDALADRMLRLLTDDPAWERMSRDALAFARGMSWERVVRAYLEMYAGALGRPVAPADEAAVR